MLTQYQCTCGGTLLPQKISISDKGVLLGTVCYKQWCPKCGNSRLNDDGSIMYFVPHRDYFSFDPADFWAPPAIPLQHKMKFIQSVIKLAEEHRFEGKQTFTMEQVRNAFRQGMAEKDLSTYGGEK